MAYPQSWLTTPSLFGRRSDVAWKPPASVQSADAADQVQTRRANAERQAAIWQHNFAVTVQRLLQANRWTVSRLARTIGMGDDNLRDILDGKTRLTLPNLARIADAVDLDVTITSSKPPTATTHSGDI